MSLSATVVDPLVAPPPAGWEAFVGAQRLPPAWQPGLVTAVDWCAATTSSLVLVTDAGGTPVAAFHARHVSSVRAWRFTRPGRRPLTGMTVCVTPRPNEDAGVAFAEDTDPRDRTEAVRVFEKAVRAALGPAGPLVLAYQGLYREQLAVVPTTGRVRVPLHPQMVLVNRWSDPDAYLRSLQHKWRYHLRRLRERIEQDDSLRVELCDRIDPVQACWLVERVRRRHSPRFLVSPPLPVRYFEQLAALPGVRFLTYTDRGGRLLAFTAVHDDGRDLLPVCWGTRDPSDGGRRDLYFDQYLRLVELMVTSGRRSLLLGRGMEQIKRRYGARPEPRWGLVGLP